jgi:hypothetical protein
MEKAIRNQPPGDEASRIAGAFSDLAASPQLNLLHRYEARLHRIYQRALDNLLILREPELPKEPNPISEQCAPVAQGPGEDVPEEVDLPTPSALPAGADASPKIASLLGKRKLPNEIGWPGNLATPGNENRRLAQGSAMEVSCDHAGEGGRPR